MISRNWGYRKYIKEGKMKKRSLLMQLAITGMFILGLITAAQADPINLALTGTATQSSTYSPDYGAGKAIDGNTDGNIYHGSVTHSAYQVQPWWQVDLLGTFHLDRIILWNRTDCCSDRLSNFSVSVLDNLGTTVWTHNYYTSGGSPAPSLTIDLPDNTWGEIVKVRLNGAGSGYLSLAEAQVFGSAVPAPGAIFLLGPGLIGLAGLRRKFKK